MQITIENQEEKYAPATLPQLRLSVVGGALFVDIIETEEAYDTSSTKTIAQTSVSVADVHNALITLVKADKGRDVANEVGRYSNTTVKGL